MGILGRHINFFLPVLLMGFSGFLLIIIYPDRVDASENPVLPPPVTIVVKENNRINSATVMLGQISDIRANPLITESLEKLEIGSSPKPDEIKVFDKKKIVSIIRSQRYLPDRVAVSSPDRIYVKRMSQVVSERDVRHFVEQQLANRFPDRSYEILRFDVRGLELYPRGEVGFNITKPQMVDSKGRLSFFLDLTVDRVKTDRVSVKGLVAVYESVLLAGRPLKKGQAVTRDDFYFEKMNLFDLGHTYIKDFRVIEGKQLKNNIKKGEPVRDDFFKAPYLVKKGDVVNLVVKNETLRIVTSGVCMENGQQDTLIRVENIGSGKEVRGIVKGKSKVEVIY